jgi:hypothetical protein
MTAGGILTTMSHAATKFRKVVTENVLRDAAGKAPAEQRRAAFENRGVAEPSRALLDKVTRNAWKVTDQDVAAVKQAGVSEDEIYELVICAALGQATRQLDGALAALDQAVSEATEEVASMATSRKRDAPAAASGAGTGGR